MTATLVRQVPETFTFPDTGQGVRIASINGDPWFNGADTCSVLSIRNSRDAIAALDDDEKGVVTTDTLGGPQNLTFVSEAGLYTLILRSRKPEAKPFRRWITHSVIPSIRRTGGYSVGGNGSFPSSDVATISRRDLAQMIIAEADRAEAAEQRAAELEPAAEAWQVLGEGNGNHSLREAAAILSQDPSISTGQNRLMDFIRDEEMVDPKGRPYSRYSKYLVQRPTSYTHPHTGEPVLKAQLRVTPDGIAYLRRRLGGIGGADATA